jgi:chromosome segregation ATPase
MSLKSKICLLKKKADKYDNLKKKYNSLKCLQNNQFLELYRIKCEEHEYALDKISYLTGENDDLKGELIQTDKIIKNLNLEINALEEYVQNRQKIINDLSAENKDFKNTFSNITNIWTKHIHQRDNEISFLKELIVIKENEINNLKTQLNISVYQQNHPKNINNDTLDLDCTGLTGENSEHVKILVNSLNNLLSDDTNGIDWHLLEDNDYNNEQNNEQNNI